MFDGNARTAAAIINNAPPIPTNPLPISSQDNRPSLVITSTRIYMAAAMIVTEIAVEIIRFGSPTSLVNAAISANITPMVTRPC